MHASDQPLAHTNNPSAARTPTFEQARAAYLANASAGDLKKFFALYFELTAPFQELFDTVFGPPGLWSAFITAPSSMRGHHRERGGNLRHSVEVAEISLLLASRKNIGQQVDRQVQITASLTHDLGKLLEYECGPGGTCMSDYGRMIGHKFTGFALMWGPLHLNAGISEHQILAILNCLSNFSFGAGATRGAATLEAEILSEADHLSAKQDQNAVSQASRGGRAGFGVRQPHQRETPFHVTPRLPEPEPEPAPVTHAAPPSPGAASRAASAISPSLQARLRAAVQAGAGYGRTSARPLTT